MNILVTCRVCCEEIGDRSKGGGEGEGRWRKKGEVGGRRGRKERKEGYSSHKYCADLAHLLSEFGRLLSMIIISYTCSLKVMNNVMGANENRFCVG